MGLAFPGWEVTRVPVLAFSLLVNMSPRRRTRSRSRRGSRALSTRSIYSRTSARSQANQIYSLRKRVARIGRRLRPDVKVAVTSLTSATLNNSAFSSTYQGDWHLSRTHGLKDDQRIGDKIYLKSFTYYGNFEYSNNFGSDTATLEARGGVVRIVALQLKTITDYGAAIDPKSIIEQYTNSGAGYDLNAVAPLSTGVTKSWAVLRDMRFRLTHDNPIKQLRLKITPKWRTIRYDGMTPAGIPFATDAPNHGIYVFVCVGGLHWQTTEYEQVALSSRVKYTFTDM
uniref:Cap n=1 Tax=CRESS DNA virus TaxID=3138951 RepID=A0AAU8H8N1_9VIRU